MRLEEFARQQSLTLASTKTFQNPNTDPNWRAHHYQCRLSNGRGEFIFDYSKGTGIVDRRQRPIPPQLAECLGCLQSDVLSVENAADFEEWASDLGWDADSLRAYRAYRGILRQHRALCAFFGRDAYRGFLECEPE
jgi:hypothetical protein